MSVDDIHAFASAMRKLMMMQEFAVSCSLRNVDYVLVLVLLVPLPAVQDHELWSVEQIVCAAVNDPFPVLLPLQQRLVISQRMEGYLQHNRAPARQARLRS